MAFRESTVVIIETGRTSVRAGLGIYDLLKTPAVVRSLSFLFVLMQVISTTAQGN
jgi:hypothetical protein